MTLKVCIAGATGWAGRPLALAAFKTEDLKLVGAVSRTHAGKKLGTVLGLPELTTPISSSVSDALRTATDVLMDYTKPDVAKSNVLNAIGRGVHVVIGTSGLTDEDYIEIHEAAVKHHVGVIAAGNFSITAVLLERFAREAARFLSHWEILDFASASKMDAPSGVSRELAFRLSEIKRPEVEKPIEETVGPKESRGTSLQGTQIHSIRLPGYTIGLQIIFSETNERLVLHHEAGGSADPYIAGALLAIRKVNEHVGLIRGLDSILASSPNE